MFLLASYCHHQNEIELFRVSQIILALDILFHYSLSRLDHKLKKNTKSFLFLSLKSLGLFFIFFIFCWFYLIPLYCTKLLFISFMSS